MAEETVEYQGRRRALVISISQYSKLANLDFCEKDGIKICEVLSKLGYDIQDKYKLIGGRVEYDKLRDSILQFFYDKSIDPKDTVLFYFSGHGIIGDDGEHYLSTSEIDPDMPRWRGVPFDELTKAREECNSKSIFTILDCCYSGADRPSKGKGLDVKQAQEESANAAKNTIKDKSNVPGEGKCILAACKPMQKAFEYKEKGQSFFSYYLAEALTNRGVADEDGDVTPYVLNNYIDNKIRSLPADIRPKQTPLLNCSTSGKIVLANYPKDSTAELKGASDYLLKLLQLEKIQEFNSIRKEGDLPLSLRKVDLSRKNLRGVDLHEADLTEAKLIGTKLVMANLNGAKLKAADLGAADLRSADLYGAILSGANLTGADLRGADLKGMIDFSGANLTGADIRGVDLTGMVNFSGAKLHDVDFTGSATNKGLINFAGANIRNAKGLPAFHKPNEYLEELKSFSDSVKQQFKNYNIAAEQAKPIEESVKELVEEVQDIQEPDEIDEIKKKNINSKFVDMADKVIKALPPRQAETRRIFTVLAPFVKIIGVEVSEIVESLQTKGAPVVHVVGTAPVTQPPSTAPFRRAPSDKVHNEQAFLPRDVAVDKEIQGNKTKILIPILAAAVGIVLVLAIIFMHPFTNITTPPPSTTPSTTPTAIDQSVATATNTPINFKLQGTDPNPNANLTATIVTQPSHGTLGTITQDTSNLYSYDVTYTPNQNFTQSDSFTFKVSDGKVDSNIATIAINPPTAKDQSPLHNTPPKAEDMKINTTRSNPVAFILNGTDPDGDKLNFSIVTKPIKGNIAAFDPSSGAVTYDSSPFAMIGAKDTFAFKATDSKGAVSNIAFVTITQVS